VEVKFKMVRREVDRPRDRSYNATYFTIIVYEEICKGKEESDNGYHCWYTFICNFK
jgi:hypothetical protein